MRRLLTATFLLLLLLPAAHALAADNPSDLLVDACRDEKVDGTYSQRTYKRALDQLPADSDQYTACRDVINRARLAALNNRRSNKNSGGGGTGHTGQIVGYGGKCVDVAGANSANGTQIQLYTCNGTAAQSWTVGTDGTIRALGKCMDVAAAGTANGTKVQLYDCNGTGAQQWSASSGQLINPASGKCLDATGPSSADGTPLHLLSGQNRIFKMLGYDNTIYLENAPEYTG